MRCICNHRRKCTFKIHAAKLKLEETFQIKSMRLKHKCGFKNANSKMISKCLALRYLEDFRADCSWEVEVFRNRVMRDTGVRIGYYKAYYAWKKVLIMIHGSAAEQYAKVWDYVAIVKKHCPGSSAFVKVGRVERPPTVFQRMYICLQPCKEGFIQGYRHIIGVDGSWMSS